MPEGNIEKEKQSPFKFAYPFARAGEYIESVSTSLCGVFLFCQVSVVKALFRFCFLSSAVVKYRYMRESVCLSFVFTAKGKSQYTPHSTSISKHCVRIETYQRYHLIDMFSHSRPAATNVSVLHHLHGVRLSATMSIPCVSVFVSTNQSQVIQIYYQSKHQSVILRYRSKYSGGNDCARGSISRRCEKNASFALITIHIKINHQIIFA